MSDRTLRLHRVLRSTPERIYRAFLEAEAKAKWLPPRGFTCQVHHLDARVDGTYRISFHNFGSGQGHSFGGRFLELKPFETIRYADRFEDPNLPGEMTTTVSLRPVLCGTDIEIAQANVPAPIPLELCYLGWQQSLEQLAWLVEPHIQ